MKYPWNTSRRYNAYSDYFRSHFGERVQKISIDAGFTCPNRDGTCGTGGCTFCDNNAFTPSYNYAGKPIELQLKDGIEFHRKRYRRVKNYLAYYQAYTNTHASLDHLKEIYKPALEHPSVKGIVIGTRPDSVDEEKLDYFESLSKDNYLVIEYGIETVHDKTLERINRGHDFAKSEWAITESAKRGIRTGGHFIIGLPGENKADWIDSSEIISKLPLSSVKFHQLQIIRGTKMAEEFRENPADFTWFTMEEYLDIMIAIVEKLNPGIIVERIAGEVSPGLNLREPWNVRYDRVLQIFEEMLKVHNTWQGRLFNSDKHETIS